MLASTDDAMRIETRKTLCTGWAGVTEDLEWGDDLCFPVGGKMFAVVNLERPHQLAFKCTREEFGQLSERPGLKPAPYLARAMWVQQEALGETLDRRELEPLLKTPYALVRAKLPAATRAGLTGPDAGPRSPVVPARARRRRR
jgi:predicted DNA-binding protein (MmcQ/YjbR family)